MQNSDSMTCCTDNHTICARFQLRLHYTIYCLSTSLLSQTQFIATRYWFSWTL